ncbi:response regulator [Patulibacter brassicae]|jgi:response regulator NasT|uniref:Response regulator n=1 Tax=Patulibacter brassicae TaxID=1705717 RepID=A0ABU4VI12_9ACTN|nr:response regulator [Patulibacter brassicae]MDX8150571.1 response regulator [Patulibacter brassicae]
MRILVAEDDPIIALGIARRLEQLGHVVLGPFGRGDEVRAAAREQDPDLLLLDVDLEDADGLELAAELTAEGPSRPIVVLTGLDAPELVDRSIASGVEAFLTKPVDDRQLDAALRVAAARHAELRTLQEEVSDARQALADRKVVEQAKGILIRALGIDEPTAFARIQRTARDRNVRLVEVARSIVAQRQLLEERARGDERA